MGQPSQFGPFWWLFKLSCRGLQAVFGEVRMDHLSKAMSWLKGKCYGFVQRSEVDMGTTFAIAAILSTAWISSMPAQTVLNFIQSFEMLNFTV